MTTKSKVTVRKAVKAARKAPVKKSALVKVIERVAEGKMAESMHLPPAPQLSISITLLPTVDWTR